MEEPINRIDTIQDFNRMKGVETLHPLVSVIDQSKAVPLSGTRNMFGFYGLFLKESDCGNLAYGRQNYDYQEGTIVCVAPNQMMGVIRHEENIYEPKGWAIVFHPDLIRGTSLGKSIKSYSFFSYQVNEALHISEREKQIFMGVLNIIRLELEHPIDTHSKILIANNIELLLNYCARFYERQFTVRGDINKDILMKFETLLDDYYKENKQSKLGIPTVKYCASELCFSPNYFGDMMKKETGRNAQEMIQDYVMDKAKEMILGTDKTISQISDELGFQYPTHFSRQFKKYENCSPIEYRSSNN